MLGKPAQKRQSPCSRVNRCLPSGPRGGEDRILWRPGTSQPGGGFILYRRMTGLGMQLTTVILALGRLRQEEKSSRSAELFFVEDPVPKNI